MTDEDAKLWDDYKATGRVSLRDELIVRYMPLVRYVATRVAAGLPNSIEHDDLVSYGVFGLIDAIAKFEPARGIKFETYAVPRIKGAIIDELRVVDWVPRSVRAKARALEAAITRLESTLHRRPTDAELAEDLDITESEVQQILAQTASVGMAALDESLPGGIGGGGRFCDRDDNMTLGDTVADLRDTPDFSHRFAEMKDVLVDALDELTQREGIVVTLYYHEGLSLAEIGVVLGVTESRVCQIHTKAVLQLRSHMLAEVA